MVTSLSPEEGKASKGGGPVRKEREGEWGCVVDDVGEE
jgi:hypothetical protein